MRLLISVKWQISFATWIGVVTVIELSNGVKYLEKKRVQPHVLW